MIISVLEHMWSLYVKIACPTELVPAQNESGSHIVCCCLKRVATETGC